MHHYLDKFLLKFNLDKSRRKFRHNISLGLDNTIWTATQMYPYSKVVQKYKKSYGLFDDDAITMLNKDGKILFTKSVLEILSDNNMVDENIF